MTMLGIIGGSGLYDLPGLADMRPVAVESAFGAPSDIIMRGRLGETELAFLPRHGRGHRLAPSGINYRANIDCLKRLGVTDILSLSAVGSLREEMKPGDFVLVDQVIDFTRARPLSFFGNGLVAHVSMARPTCDRLRRAVFGLAGEIEPTLHERGTCIVIEGPQFSTRAESQMFRQWGADLVGMTNLPEVKLAREAEICYLTVAMVTDYDCWHPEHEAVEVGHVLQILAANAEAARRLAAAAAPRIRAGRAASCEAGCDRALEVAIVTAPEQRDATLVGMLDAVAGRVLGGDREGKGPR